jgi:isopentenyldiphosphate isomerase
MDNQIILASTDQGQFTGEYLPKEEGHRGQGKRHLAITVLLSNDKGQVLLQQRKHRIFDDIWDFTGATHPLHLENGHDESYEEATARCLKREYGIEGVETKNLGEFNYFSQDGGHCENEGKPLLCENEHCATLVGEYNGEISLNSEVGYGYKWMDKQEFLKDIESNPQNYSPWAVEGVKVLKSGSFFNS